MNEEKIKQAIANLKEAMQNTMFEQRKIDLHTAIEALEKQLSDNDSNTIEVQCPCCGNKHKMKLNESEENK